MDFKNLDNRRLEGLAKDYVWTAKLTQDKEDLEEYLDIRTEMQNRGLNTESYDAKILEIYPNAEFPKTKLEERSDIFLDYYKKNPERIDVNSKYIAAFIEGMAKEMGEEKIPEAKAKELSKKSLPLYLYCIQVNRGEL